MIKFDRFAKYAERLGGNRIATGHYARNLQNNGKQELHKGVDNNKDQTYFLHAIDSKILPKVLFPIGAMNKSEVREYAYKKGLPNHDKPDSTGICFIGERPFKEFIQTFVPPKPGDIVNTDGEFLGKHDSLAYFTIGQRKDIGIGGMKNHSGEPWYVADKDMNSNKLIVVQGRDHALLWKKKVFVGSLNWLDEGVAATIKNGEIIECEAKSRYRQDDAKCSFKTLNDGVIVEFNDSQWAITKGQYLVFYKEGKCLGGG